MNAPVPFTGCTPEDLVAHVASLRLQMRPFRRVILNLEGASIVDVNRQEAHFPGLTYGHPLLLTLLKAAGAAFDPTLVHQPPPHASGVREHACSARYPWGQDRVL